MKTRKLALLSAVVVTGTLAAVSEAGIATLDLQVNSSANSWKLYVTLSPDNQGLASFDVDVAGSGGLVVNASTVKAVQTPVFDGDGNFLYTSGFSLNRSNYTGTPGVQITASQATTASDIGYLVFNVGVGSPYLIAQGTFTNSGSGGALTAFVENGAFINAFPTSYTLGGATEALSVVTDTESVAAVPEAASLSLLALGAMGALGALMRRRG